MVPRHELGHALVSRPQVMLCFHNDVLIGMRFFPLMPFPCCRWAMPRCETCASTHIIVLQRSCHKWEILFNDIWSHGAPTFQGPRHVLYNIIVGMVPSSAPRYPLVPLCPQAPNGTPKCHGGSFQGKIHAFHAQVATNDVSTTYVGFNEILFHCVHCSKYQAHKKICAFKHLIPKFSNF